MNPAQRDHIEARIKWSADNHLSHVGVARLALETLLANHDTLAKEREDAHHLANTWRGESQYWHARAEQAERALTITGPECDDWRRRCMQAEEEREEALSVIGDTHKHLREVRDQLAAAKAELDAVRLYRGSEIELRVRLAELTEERDDARRYATLAQRKNEELTTRLAEVTQERDDARRDAAQTHICGRWNIETTEDGFRVCRNEHEKHEPCVYTEYVPSERVKTLQLQLEQAKTVLNDLREASESTRLYVESIESTIKRALETWGQEFHHSGRFRDTLTLGDSIIVEGGKWLVAEVERLRAVEQRLKTVRQALLD